MAYDRYEREQRWREGRSGNFEDRRPRSWDRDDRDDDDRGFFSRMGDEFRSWFGDEDDRGREWDRGGDRDFRGSGWRSGDRSREQRAYRPIAGDYSRSGYEDRDNGRDRDPYRRSNFMGPRDRSNFDDRHYEEMRRRQAEELDRDYDEYRRERASQFENFGSWRERRMSKRQLLSGIHEHMEVLGSDEKHVGTVDRVAGDRIILTRSDPDSGGVHHSLTCSDVDRVEGGRVILDCSAEKAKERWRDESRSRALLEREDQGQAGPHVLDRSFSGTYR